MKVRIGPKGKGSDDMGVLQALRRPSSSESSLSALAVLRGRGGDGGGGDCGGLDMARSATSLPMDAGSVSSLEMW